MKSQPNFPQDRIDTHALTWRDRLFALLLVMAMATIALNIYSNEREQKKTGASTPVIEHNLNQ